MIDSKYIEDVTVPTFDGKVTQLVSEYRLDGGGTPFKIAIENSDHKLYRVLAASGFGAYMYLTQSLLQLGFMDTLANVPEGKDGYDSWFIVTPEVEKKFSVDRPSPDLAEEIIQALDSMKDLSITERRSLIQSRVGQGLFRERVVAHWKRCAVTGADYTPLLRASHIKPWRNSNNTERLDPFNGLLLAPNVDCAFDAGYLSFDREGRAMLARAIQGERGALLHLRPELQLDTALLDDRHRHYLEYHRSEVFLG